MTLYLIDIASWQTAEKRSRDPLNLDVAKSKGVDLVNIKIGQGDWYGYRSWMRTYADWARRIGLGVSTFHWLDNSASGAAQARLAYERMKAIGGPDGMAHQCDCEDTQRPATERIWRDYVAAMQDLLGRPIVNYTGDWWWTASSRNWRGVDATPYLWAAPNRGYLTSYPGDTSSHWHAGYGGWGDYAVLQYAVSPIAGAGGGDLSKSAIRDPKVWAALTGENQEEEMSEEVVVSGVQKALRAGLPLPGRVGERLVALGWDPSMSPWEAQSRVLEWVLTKTDDLEAGIAEVKRLLEAAPQAPSLNPVAVAKALIAELQQQPPAA